MIPDTTKRVYVFLWAYTSYAASKFFIKAVLDRDRFVRESTEYGYRNVLWTDFTWPFQIRFLVCVIFVSWRDSLRRLHDKFSILVV
jgi:hypothetical protein